MALQAGWTVPTTASGSPCYGHLAMTEQIAAFEIIELDQLNLEDQCILCPTSAPKLSQNLIVCVIHYQPKWP